MPIDLLLYLAFLPAVLALVVTPGPDMMFAMAQGLRGGTRFAVAAAAGISAGALINATLAGAGLGYVVERAPWVFGVVRWVGVAYLAYLAWKTLTTPLTGESKAQIRPSRAFRDGLIVNLSNPSVIFFILAFIPQFVDPTRPIFAQFVIYGATIAVMGFAVKSTAGAFAGQLGPWLARSPRAERTLRWITASVFGALAARVALTGVKA